MTATHWLHHALIKMLVQRHIFCPLTGNLLDIRTCVVVLDKDGDPAHVFDPAVKEMFDKTKSDLPEGNSWMDRS